MLFQPKRIAHATTEQEIDSALATADQVIVEGDDQLLSYAVGKASADPQNKITVETGEVTTTITPTTDVAASDADVVKMAPRRANRATYAASLVVAIVSLVVATGVSYWTLDSKSSIPTSSGTVVLDDLPSERAPDDLPPIGTPSAEVPERRAPPSDYTLMLVQMLVWPVVTIISIIALTLIAWKAIVGGRNLEITWKVTEKVQGKVVITKQRAASKPRRAVA